MDLKQLFTDRLKTSGLNLQLGPFAFNIKSSIPKVIDEVYENYQFHQVIPDDNFIDFYITLKPSTGLRRWFKPQVNFYFEHHKPFKPLPLNQAYPMLEWGMNWTIANYGHYYLIIHSAVVVKNNKAIVLPAPQGSGKSTLCASLVNSGWRLFSDEIAIISLENGLVYPCCRPISLKNQSINIIDEKFPQARLMAPVKDTTKGTVSLMKPYQDSVINNDPAEIVAVVFPKYEAETDGEFIPRTKSDTLIQLIQNSFNYHVISKQGFDIASDIIESAQCYDYTYSDIDKAIADFDGMISECN